MIYPKFERSDVENIWVHFRYDREYRDIGQLFEHLVRVTHDPNAPDIAKIPVSPPLTLKQARAITARFQYTTFFPADRRIYMALSDAIKESEE
jgi:hypothetical protein